MRVKLSKKHIECGRIFVDRNNRGSFRLVCFYCSSVFSHWLLFSQHIEARHIDLDKSYQRAKSRWLYDKSNVNDREDNKSRACSAEKNVPPTELVLVSEETRDWAMETQDLVECEEEHGSECNEIIGLKVEFLQSTDKRQLRLPETEVNTTTYPTESGLEQPICEAKIIQTKVENPIQVPKESENVIRLHKNKRKSASDGNSLETDKFNEAAYEEKSDIFSKWKDYNWTGRTFYNLRETNPEIMLDFIDLLRQHTCQWDPDDPDHFVKDKRDESSEQLSLKLYEHWRIKSSPQVVRTSVLALCRWFANEYLRHREEGDSFQSGHPDYYKQLYAFLPRQHIKVFACDQCSRKCKTHGMLLSHKYTAHGGDVPYKCSYCPRTFVHLSSFRHHENRHTKQLLWECELCNYSSPSKNDFTLHKVTHTDIRAYVCDLCGASYKSSTSLNVHKRAHAPPRLECPHCGRLFHENYRLKRHMWQHSGIVSSPNNVFPCNQCEKSFTRKGNLKKHLLRHFNEENVQQSDVDDFDAGVEEVDIDEMDLADELVLSEAEV